MSAAAWAVDPVVLIVNVDVAEFPPGVTLLGWNVHEVFAGNVPHVSRTALEKEPPWGEIVRPYVAVDPAFTEALVGELPRVKSDPTAAKFTDCGLLVALSVMVNAPLRAPEAVGVNVTLIVQLALPFKDPGQLLVCA